MVDHIRGVDGLGGIQAPKKLKSAYRLTDAPAASDSVEISSDVMRLKGIEGIRLDRVMEIRSQIAAGLYFTPDKLDKALDRALDHIAGAR